MRVGVLRQCGRVEGGATLGLCCVCTWGTFKEVPAGLDARSSGVGSAWSLDIPEAVGQAGWPIFAEVLTV